MIYPQSEIAVESNHRYSETAADKSCQTSHGIEGTDTTGSINHHNHKETTTNDEPIVELRQKLMVADEVYLYKIPPLQTSGGHRYVFIPLCEALTSTVYRWNLVPLICSYGVTSFHHCCDFSTNSSHIFGTTNYANCQSK